MASIANDIQVYLPQAYGLPRLPTFKTSFPGLWASLENVNSSVVLNRRRPVKLTFFRHDRSSFADLVRLARRKNSINKNNSRVFFLSFLALSFFVPSRFFSSGFFFSLFVVAVVEN